MVVNGVSLAERATRKLKYPKSVFFIVSNEFCERFSYYGMRTILTLYLNGPLGMSEDQSTIVYHTFVMFCYFFPLIGAIIADSWLDKFRTIFYLSIVYSLGNIVVSLGSATNLGLPAAEFTYLGLFLIAVGTGGIKPCVSAFGGDQFVVPEQERQLAAFFSVFYFAINAGSLISTYLTPELKATSCLGSKTCYPLAFGIPAALMVLSLLIFIAGKKMYVVKKPQGNVLVEVTKCISSAVGNKLKSKEKREHWLDHADKKFPSKLRSDIRSMMRVLLLFVPLPLFWALFDQQGSRWTFQAKNMNGQIGSYILKPDQMQVVNPLLILLFLPVFQSCLYPCLSKLRLIRRPLQKMTAGGLLAAAAFLISALVELELQKGYPVYPSEGLAQVRVFNALPCDVNLAYNDKASYALKQHEVWTNVDMPAHGNITFLLKVEAENCIAGGSDTLNLTAGENTARSYHLFSTEKPGKVQVLGPYMDKIEKDSNPSVRITYRFPDSGSHEVTFYKDEELVKTLKLKNSAGSEFIEPSEEGALTPSENYVIKVDGKAIGGKTELGIGGIYTVFIDENAEKSRVEILADKNTLHMLWLLPQYIVMTMGEVMFSVTGNEFAFTQAPVSMKSVLTSCWLLTVAFGNLIVVLISEARFFNSRANEFFLFAGLMVVDMGIFILLAIRYKYVSVASEDEDEGANANEMTESIKTDKLAVDKQ